MSIRSFSGTHVWHSSVLNDTDADKPTAERIVHNIESRRCPRCEGPLREEFPAGSRITKCRSIPICSPCGSDEADQCTTRELSPASAWPVDRAEIEKRRRENEAREVRILGVNPDGFLVTELGVVRLRMPPPQFNTGGWAQYGRPPIG